MNIDQGSILNAGVIAITAGITFLTQRELVVGLALVIVGAGLVYWRENRKGNNSSSLNENLESINNPDNNSDSIPLDDKDSNSSSK